MLFFVSPNANHAPLVKFSPKGTLKLGEDGAFRGASTTQGLRNLSGWNAAPLDKRDEKHCARLECETPQPVLRAGPSLFDARAPRAKQEPLKQKPRQAREGTPRGMASLAASLNHSMRGPA